MPQVINLPEKRLRSIGKVPEELKPAVLTAITEKNLSTKQTEELVQEVVSHVGADESTVQEKVDGLFADAAKIEKKYAREIDKLINGASVLAPEALVREAYGRAYGEKVSQEKLNAYLSVVIGCMFERLKKDGLLDEVFAEANRW
jgi:molybdopterin-biosynthesis enzyme MoeA-like protein